MCSEVRPRDIFLLLEGGGTRMIIKIFETVGKEKPVIIIIIISPTSLTKVMCIMYTIAMLLAESE